MGGGEKTQRKRDERKRKNGEKEEERRKAKKDNSGESELRKEFTLKLRGWWGGRRWRGDIKSKI